MHVTMLCVYKRSIISSIDGGGHLAWHADDGTEPCTMTGLQLATALSPYAKGDAMPNCTILSLL